MPELSIDTNYKSFLQDVKERIRTAQIKAMVKVNQELILLYRELGKMIIERQESQGW